MRPLRSLGTSQVVPVLPEQHLRHLRYLRRRAPEKIRNLHHVRLPALETPWISRSEQEDDMSLINDYTYQAITDQQERDLARLAEQNRQVRLALSG